MLSRAHQDIATSLLNPLHTHLHHSSTHPLIRSHSTSSHLLSIDGKLWEDMRKDFTHLLKNLPGPDKLKKIAKKHLDILLAGSILSDDIIDANCVAEITMKVFIEFLFEREWDSKFDIVVKAR